jgi:hypothetical protein
MGLHAGFYTQHLSNRGTDFGHTEDVSHRKDESLNTKEFLKNVSNQTLCSQSQKFSLNANLPEWLGEREEGA